MKCKTLPSHYIDSIMPERVSSSASKKGSITVEAAMAVPLFFLAVVSLLYLSEMMAIRTSVRAGLQYASKRVAEESHVVSVIVPSNIEKDVVHAIGGERLKRSIIVEGIEGIHCDESRMSVSTGIGELVAAYEVRLPIPIFGVPPIKCREHLRIKAWTGYEKQPFGVETDKTVYVTETGIVYHKNYQCTYLDLSIHVASQADIETLRNESGGKYYPCEQCKGTGNTVYITDTGNRYHSSLSCRGLKRTVYAIPLSEAAGKGACSRCGQ